MEIDEKKIAESIYMLEYLKEKKDYLFRLRATKSSSSRIIDTFAARDLQLPEGRNLIDSLSRYTLRDGYGLRLQKRRGKRKKRTII